MAKERRVIIEAIADGKWRAHVTMPAEEGGNWIMADGATIDKALANLAGVRINMLSGLLPLGEDEDA